MRFARAVAIGLAALALALAACGGGAPTEQGTAQGTVVAVDAGTGQVTLDHGEIPGLMGAMQMSFPVADPKLLQGVTPGMKVEFDVVHAGGQYTVTGIRPCC
jgi:Cu/Ag efflux protein CusF